MYTKRIVRVRKGLKHQLSLHIKDFDVVNDNIIVKGIYLTYTKEVPKQHYVFQYQNHRTGKFYPDYAAAIRDNPYLDIVSYQPNPEKAYIYKRMMYQWGEYFKEDRLQIAHKLFALFKSGDVDCFKMESEL